MTACELAESAPNARRPRRPRAARKSLRSGGEQRSSRSSRLANLFRRNKAREEYLDPNAIDGRACIQARAHAFR